MKSPLLRDIPPRAAVAVLALVLLATVVTGREQQPTQTVAASVSRPQPAVGATVERPHLQLPVRTAHERSVSDLFPGQATPAAVPVPATGATASVQAPPVPSAPPLPYRYLGRMTRGERTLVYLLRGEEVLIAEAGQPLENAYRVENISESAMELVYMPLGVRQTLSIPVTQ